MAAQLLWAYYHAVKRREGVPVQPAPTQKPETRRTEDEVDWLNSTARGSSRARRPAQHLVVFLHGYGADGNDLIEIGRAWQGLLPDAAFVSPHAPEPCGQAPIGRAVVSAHLPRSQRALERRQRGRAGARTPFLDAELDAPQPAALGAGAGRLSARAP